MVTVNFLETGSCASNFTLPPSQNILDQLELLPIASAPGDVRVTFGKEYFMKVGSTAGT
jgi:hypothetical protein